MPRSARFVRATQRVSHIPSLAAALDACMSARTRALQRTAEAFVLKEQLEAAQQRARRAESEAGELVDELTRCKLQLAQVEYEVLERVRKSRG